VDPALARATTKRRNFTTPSISSPDEAVPFSKKMSKKKEKKIGFGTARAVE
jgi:hypothetical protein